jgi:hypothetical protein
MFCLRSVSNGPDRGWNTRHGGGEVAGDMLCRPQRSGRAVPLRTAGNVCERLAGLAQANDCAAASVREMDLSRQPTAIPSQ